MGEAARDLRDAQEFEPIIITPDPDKDETYEFLKYDPNNQSYLARTKDDDIITIKAEDLESYKRVAITTQEIIKLPNIELFFFNKLRMMLEDGNEDFVSGEELVVGSEFEDKTPKYIADAISSFKNNINQLQLKYLVENKRGQGYRLVLRNE